MQTLCCEIEGLKSYEIKTWEANVCKSLAAIRVLDEKAMWDYSGCINIKNYIETDRRAGVTDSLIKVVSAIRKITEGFALAEDYLIDQAHISLDIDKLWFSNDGIKLLPGQSDKTYLERICELLPQLGREDIAERIKEKDSEGALSYKTLLSFLSSFELELR